MSIELSQKKIYDSLVETIPEFNNRSKVAFIHKIEWNPDEQVMHIYFDYFGEKRPDGNALINLSKLYNSGMKLAFNHTFNRREYDQRPYVKKRREEHRREYYQRPNVKERQKEYHREYSQRPKVKERVKEYHKEYWKRSEVKERQRDYQREYRKNPDVKERRKGYQREYSQRPEVRERDNENKRYRYYLRTHNLTKEKFSIEKWREMKNSGGDGSVHNEYDHK